MQLTIEKDNDIGYTKIIHFDQQINSNQTVKRYESTSLTSVLTTFTGSSANIRLN